MTIEWIEDAQVMSAGCLTRPLPDLVEVQYLEAWHAPQELTEATRSRLSKIRQRNVSDICPRILEPMTLNDLVEYIASDNYSAELALQHALLLLARDKG